jgi:hypothetical protein
MKIPHLVSAGWYDWYLAARPIVDKVRLTHQTTDVEHIVLFPKDQMGLSVSRLGTWNML